MTKKQKAIKPRAHSHHSHHEHNSPYFLHRPSVHTSYTPYFLHTPSVHTSYNTIVLVSHTLELSHTHPHLGSPYRKTPPSTSNLEHMVVGADLRLADDLVQLVHLGLRCQGGEKEGDRRSLHHPHILHTIIIWYSHLQHKFHTAVPGTRSPPRDVCPSCTSCSGPGKGCTSRCLHRSAPQCCVGSLQYRKEGQSGRGRLREDNQGQEDWDRRTGTGGLGQEDRDRRTGT